MITFHDIITEPQEVIKKVREWRNRDDIRMWMYESHLISEEEHLAWIESLSKEALDSSAKYKRVVWVIYDSQGPIGVVNLQDINWKHLTASWGIYIAEKTLDKPAGLQAIKFIAEKAFNDFKLEKLNSTVFANNKKALIFNQTCGMRPQGVFRSEIQFDPLLRIDLFSFGLTRKEWEEWNTQKA